MAYSKATPHYGIPYISDNEIMAGSDEQTANLIIDNQIRAGILGAGGTRVYQNGSFTAVINSGTGLVDVTVFPIDGKPSVQGIANNCLVEVFDPVTWANLGGNTFYYLYLQATTDTYADASTLNIISSLTPITQLDHLFLATVDTTGIDEDPPVQPQVDVSPPGKPTAFNLFQLLNNNHDPFGPSLTQSVLTVLEQFTVILGVGNTALFQQLNPDATNPVITIENVSDQPEISSSGKLRFADSFIPQGFAFSDESNTAYQGVALSLIGALNELLTELLAHINDNQDPHGETLYQTNLVLSGFLEIPQIIINPPVSPPLPPGSPPAPPLCNISSTGELRLCDMRGGIFLTEDGFGNGVYDGVAVSIIGALNELLTLIDDLSSQIDGIVGLTTPAMSPVVFEVWPEELGLPIHFKLVVSEAEDFTNIIATKESKDDATNWYYEWQPPAPPVPPSPPIGPNTLPGVIDVPDLAPEPVWIPLSEDGLEAAFQVHHDGRPTKVKYELKTIDGILLRHKYSVGVAEWNGQYGEFDLAAFVFG